MIKYKIGNISDAELKKEYPYLEISSDNQEFVPNWEEMDAKKDFKEVEESDLMENLFEVIS